jgi:hypothetical protein
MKYKIGDTVLYTGYNDSILQGVILGINGDGDYLITTPDTDRNTLWEKLEWYDKGIVKLKEILEYRNIIHVEWVKPYSIKNKILPQDGAYYTVLDDSIPGGKMIFRSNGVIDNCGMRESDIPLLTNFNFPEENMTFNESGLLCFMDCGNPRYFFPSPQEDIDLLNSYINKGTKSPEKEIVYSGKTENMVTITREQLKEIHDIACDTWKTKIEKIARNQPFGDIELSETKVQEMRDAATGAQKPTIEKIFGIANQFKVDVKANKVTRSDGREISLFSESCFGGVLSPSFNSPCFIKVDKDFDIKVSICEVWDIKYIEIIEKK